MSIVVASGAGGEFLPRCIESLREQVARTGSEFIVVDRCSGETAARIERDYPFVKLIRTDPAQRLSVPELRKAGVLAAAGQIAAIIEEHKVAPPHWIEAIQESFEDDVAAVGGPILDNNDTRSEDSVVYFLEYHNYLPPWPDGDRYLLNGANIAYDRRRLTDHKDSLGAGYWEVDLHPKLAESGRFLSVPAMGVHHTGPFAYGYYLEQRYLISRAWGGAQREKVGAWKRLLHILVTPVLPVLLLARIACRVSASEGMTPKFLKALPLLVPAAVVYASGEWLGYLLGPGNAMERIE